MTKKRHRLPSRIRYEKTHPVISVRMPKEWIDELDTFLDAQDLSRGDFFRISFEKQKNNYHKAYLQGDKDGYRIGHKAGCEKGKTGGYTKGMNDWAIWIYCLKCGKAVYITPNSDAHKAIVEFLKERGWTHVGCPGQ